MHARKRDVSCRFLIEGKRSIIFVVIDAYEIQTAEDI